MGLQIAYCSDQLQPRPDGSFSFVLVRLRVTEVNQDPIAHVLRYEPAEAVDRIRTLRVLLIVTYRPEFEPPWIGRPYVTALTINRLGEREIAAMIDRVTGNKPLPANIRQDIIERTDGIPLFVEEMTKAVLEAESEAKLPSDGCRRSVPGSGGPGKPARLADGAA